ncbi:MAG TPA: hypothetical protein VM580_07170 [Labilithrix sp.]|nr:hypothetical protein [Labilithrix sp.]
MCPTREGRRLGILAVLAHVFVVGCVRTASVVEAPMVSAESSAATIALATRSQGAFSRPKDLPFKSGDRLRGTYQCRQGRTEMTLTFDEVSRNPARSAGDDDSVDVVALFEFHFDGNRRPGYPSVDGSSKMRGTYDVKSSRLRLTGEEWIDHPSNFALVNLVGLVDKTTGTYSGTVEGPGCSSFSARLDDQPSGAQRPWSRFPEERPLPGP